jgi:outer membrane protein OmpU
MNKFKKIGLTALAASLISVSANAEVSIAGGAGLTFSGGGGKNVGNGWGMNDALDFSWGGELDNGWTVDLAFKLDNSDGAASQIFDNRTLAIGLGDAGTLTFWGQAGSGVVGSYDDVMPTAYEESFDGAGSPNTGASAGNMFYYTNSMEGFAIDASYTPGGTEFAGSTEFGVAVTAVEGLTLGLAAGEDKGASTNKIDNTVSYITYAFGPVTVGYQSNESDDSAAASTTAATGAQNRGDKDYTAMAISYAVSEDFSVSIAKSEIDYEVSALDKQESTALNASYTMGSMSWSAMHADHSNASGIADQDYKDYEIAVAFSF